MISICFVSTNITVMHSTEKLLLTRMCSAFRTSLRRSIRVNTGKINLMLLCHPFQQIEELSKSRVKGMFPQDSPRHCFQVQILNKHHPNTNLCTPMVSQLELPIFPNICNVVVEADNLDSGFLAILRT